MRDWRANYAGITSLRPAECTSWNKGKSLSWIKPWAQTMVGDGRHSRRRLETLSSLSPTRRGFNPRPVHVVSLGAGTGFSPNRSALPCQYHSTVAPCLFIYRRRYIMPEVHGVIKWHLKYEFKPNEFLRGRLLGTFKPRNTCDSWNLLQKLFLSQPCHIQCSY
jgi:hypothetical protein